jgi:fructosamine-3-kinase
MFEREAEALVELKKHSSFHVPEVVQAGIMNNMAYLIMEYIPKGTGPYPHAQAGRQLAEMHKQGFDYFGLQTSNYIGSINQENTQCSSWSEFFAKYRIQYLLRQTKEYFSEAELTLFEQILNKLDDFFPTQKPSLLHGDLWSGNTFVSAQGEAVLIDPALYYGHPLMDLGMTRLFGGFSSDFYRGYQEICPLESNWIAATDIANLYPLLVHLRLFGIAYKAQISDVLSTYS